MILMKITMGYLKKTIPQLQITLIKDDPNGKGGNSPVF